MAHQMFLLSLQEAFQDDAGARNELAEMLVRIGGFVLMATGSNGLIAAFDDQWVGLFERHPAVAGCGAVQFDPDGVAASRLRLLFAHNVAAQLPQFQAAPAPSEHATPLHRSLDWHRRLPVSPFADTGITISTQPHRR